MTWPEDLEPSTTQPFSLKDGRVVEVPKAVPCFSRWSGQLPGDTFGGKAVLNFKGRPAFAELIILWSFLEARWEGVWVDSFGKRYLREFWPIPGPLSLPSEHEDLLRQIVDRTGAQGRSWDVFCWSAARVVFAEAKRERYDWIRSSQIAFLAAALDIGVPISSFLVVEWSAT